MYFQSGGASFQDAHTILLEDGTRLEASKFIICTGGHARRLGFPGAEYALSHKDIWSLKELPRKFAIVGGAATGCQLGSIFNTFGSEVIIFERSAQILSREDDDISATIQDAFTRRGITSICNIETVHRIDKHADMLEVFYRTDSREESVIVDAVTISAGWLGNVDSLSLAAAGVESQRGYVPVDEYFRTTQEHIFAAGDVTGRMMLVQSAGYQARAAAENAVLGPGQRRDHSIVPHGGFTDPEYGSVGITEEEAREKDLPYVAAVIPYSDLDRAVIDGRTEGLCKLIVSLENHRILGAHVVGEQALEVVHLVAAGMQSDMWVEQLAELEIAYPTYAAILGLAARRLMVDLGVMPLSVQWRSLEKPSAEWERRSA